ncbi:MAG: helix-turn-helix transcriptional regulator [Clostridia bacterium]|nr:helix-turn-helix transcriptional regulator [Clostridia bacterium]
MNVLLYCSDYEYCAKLESRLYSSRISRELECKILRNPDFLYQDLAGFIPDVMICCAEPFEEHAKEIISAVSRISPLCKFLVICEMPDVAVFRWAMDNGIFKIIERREDFRAIIDFTDSAFNLVSEQRRMNELNREQDRFISYATQKVKNNLLYYVLFNRKLDKRNCDFPGIIEYEDYITGRYICITVLIDWVDLDEYGIYQQIFEIEKNIGDSYLSRLDIASVFTSNDTMCLFVKEAIMGNGGFSMKYFRELFHRLLKGKYSFVMGVSEPFAIKDAHSGFVQAINASFMSFYRGWNKIYRYESNLIHLDHDMFSFGEKVLEDLKENDFDSALGAVNDMNAKFLRSCCYYPREVIVYLFNLALSICVYRKIKYSALFHTYSTRKFFSLQELCDNIRRLIETARGMFESESSAGFASNRINVIIKYITDNFCNRNISVATIADSNGLSRNYLCTLFKQKTGMTVNAFIIKLRMEKSCQLLADKSKKLYDIAYESGFSDPNYFSTVFKKQTGLSPTEYRNLLNKKQ